MIYLYFNVVYRFNLIAISGYSEMSTNERSYPSDTTDAEWEIISEILKREDPYTTGRHRTVEIRRVWDAISYLVKTGCHWRYLPHDFPPYTNVNYYFMKWTRMGLFEKVNAQVREQLRKKTDAMRHLAQQ